MASISVITVVFNNKIGLQRTIESLKNQSFNQFEYIIIDGGSTDGTLDIIKANQNIIAKFVSGKDGGIYDAMNKGLEIAEGEVIGILNSGDLYAKNVLKEVRDLFNNEKIKISYGDTLFFSSNNELVGHQIGKWSTENLSKGFEIMHPSVFIRSSIFKKYGMFNLKYKYASDVDFLLRLEREGLPFTKGNYKVYMETSGATETNFFKSTFEFYTILYNEKYITKIDFSKNIVLLFFKSAIKKIIKTEFIYHCKMQIIFICLAIYNFLLKISSFFFIKKQILRLTGIRIGRKSYIHHNCKFLSFGKLFIGNNSTINRGCVIDNRGFINIGDNVSIAHDCKIYTLGHDVNDYYFAGKKKNVVINDRAVLFANAMIMPGVVIGEGSVVLPGSVVAKDVAPYSIVGGNPAQVKGNREHHLLYNLNYGYWFSV